MFRKNITLHNLKFFRSFCNTLWPHSSRPVLIKRKYSDSKEDTSPKVLFKHLIRKCDQLPDGPKKYYKFMIKQSFKQHLKETDPERIRQIIVRSYEDADWVLKKYLPKKT